MLCVVGFEEAHQCILLKILNQVHQRRVVVYRNNIDGDDCFFSVGRQNDYFKFGRKEFSFYSSMLPLYI